MRDRALVVTPRLPWPPDDGGRIGLWQALWSVASSYDTTLVTLESPGEAGFPAPPEVERLGIRVVRVPHRPPPTPIAMLRGTFGRWPYTLARYHSRRLSAELRRLVDDLRPRFAHVNHLAMATHLDALRGTAVVLREHNVEHIWLARYAEQLRDPLTRAFALDQARRMRGAEGELCSSVDLVLAIQEHEAEALRRLAPKARVEVIPIGVDFTRFRAHAPEAPPTILLVGTFSWPPNAEGARRFLASGWPRVRALHPGTRLRLVGKALPGELAETARRAGAEPVGYVEDMAAEFARAAALVVPLWAGAGARVKIVEALGADLPVVSTTLGAEGLGVEDGTHLVLADTAEALGDGVNRLLSEPRFAASLAGAGGAYARGRFSLDVVARRTAAMCAEVAAKR